MDPGFWCMVCSSTLLKVVVQSYLSVCMVSTLPTKWW